MPAPSSSHSRSRSSSQTLIGGDEEITNTQSGSDWQNNNNDGGEQNIDIDDDPEADDYSLVPPNLHMSSSWELPPLRKQINNSNSGLGIQSNNNDVGTQIVSRKARKNHRDAAATTLGRSASPPAVSSGRRTETEINNDNSGMGVQNNNDYAGTQYAHSEGQDSNTSVATTARRLGSPPSSPRRGPTFSSKWDREINNMNSDEGVQNNNNDKGTQYVYPTERTFRSTRGSDHLSSARRRASSHFGSSKRINNSNSGRGIQNNNNDLGIQYVHQSSRHDEQIATKTRSKVADLQRVKQDNSGSMSPQSHGTPVAITNHNKTGTRGVYAKGRNDEVVVGRKHMV